MLYIPRTRSTTSWNKFDCARRECPRRAGSLGAYKGNLHSSYAAHVQRVSRAAVELTAGTGTRAKLATPRDF